MEQTKKYWFYLEPYVYSEVKNDMVFLYNTLDGKNIVSKDVDIVKLLKRIHNKRNNGVISLTEVDIINPKIKSFIADIRSMFMGDYFDQGLVNKKPVQFYPLLSFQEKTIKKKKENDGLIGQGMFDYLYQINIKSSGSLGKKEFIALLNGVSVQIRNSRIKKIKIEIAYPEQIDFTLECLEKFEFPYLNVSWVIQFDPHRIEKIRECINKMQPVDIIFNRKAFPFDYDGINSLAPVQNDNCTLIFHVENEADMIIIERIMESSFFSTSHINFLPFFNGSNLEFFEKYVFIEKEDIFSHALQMRDIMRNKVMNKNDFGVLNILSNGDVYANTHFPVLGNIYRDDIRDIIFKEMDTSKSWLRIRNKKPCRDCIYQYLCPSPSDYEIEIGKPNLCHIM